MNDTWEEWKAKKEEMKSNYKKLGMKVKEVKVDVDLLIRYCQLKGIANIGASRAQYVQQKMDGEID